MSLLTGGDKIAMPKHKFVIPTGAFPSRWEGKAKWRDLALSLHSPASVSARQGNFNSLPAELLLAPRAYSHCETSPTKILVAPTLAPQEREFSPRQTKDRSCSSLRAGPLPQSRQTPADTQ